MRFLFLLFLLPSPALNAQDYGCDKCDMLREECEVSASPKKEEVCAYFKQECLTTDTVFVDQQGEKAKPAVASAYQVVAKGKCIDYKEVKEFEKESRKETRSYQILKKDTVYSFATTNALFPGGDEALVAYLKSSLRYPESAKRRKVQRTVYMKFVVRSDGRITNIRSIRSIDPELANEAMRVIKEMPKWTPGTYKNTPVSIYYVLPVKFKL